MKHRDGSFAIRLPGVGPTMNTAGQANRPMAKLGPRTVFICCLFLAASVLALMLRLRQAQAPMTFDEFASMYFSERPFQDLWGWWLLRETNPPLFYSVLRVWRMIVPESQAALRLLPLLLSAAQVGLLTRYVGKIYGWLAALVCLLLFALSPSDIYQSEYVRGYVLAKLAVTVSFIGLIQALDDQEGCLRGWAAYVAGAVVAIYSHATMLLWPAIATFAVLAEAIWIGETGRRRLLRLLLADLVVAGLAAWELLIAYFQVHGSAQNISWIQALSLDDFVSSANLQLLLAGSLSSALMGTLVVVGAIRTIHHRVTRLSLLIVTSTIVAFKAADLVHPITTDYTLHWSATFSVLLAAAAFANAGPMSADLSRRASGFLAAAALVVIVGDGLVELDEDGSIPLPQDWRYVLATVARTPQAALLVSHESIGLVVKQACKLQFHRNACPFPLIVMQNSAKSDGWSIGGYGSAITPVRRVRDALGAAQNIFVFSRYVYTPLTPFGLNPANYREVEWDDGELIGPISIGDFPRTKTGRTGKLQISVNHTSRSADMKFARSAIDTPLTRVAR
jgi:hypothetical protein